MATRNGASSAQPGSLLLVVHDFIARSPDELSLAKGDRIELIERDDDFGDGWFLGKHLANGNNGLFPEVYTTPAPKGTLASAHRSRPGDRQPPIAPSLRSPAQPAFAPSPSAPQLRSVSGPDVTQMALRSGPTAPPGTARSFTVNSDSPVMSETLSVIDEHITDMRTPRSANANGNKRDTIGSVYSTHPLGRRSYIAGHETDEEEQQIHTEEEVLAWSPNQVAEYLEDRGVEKSHCDVFRDQEISGEVLLAMDQDSLFIKEFELGSVGRRLKTWHKIKALHEEVKRSPEAGKRASGYTTGREQEQPIPAATRSRSSTTGTIQPRALTTKRASADNVTTRNSALQVPAVPAIPTSAITKYDGFGISPLQNMTSMSRPENTYRPSAQEIRNMNRNRRHSSIDSDAADPASRITTKKQPALDKKWQPAHKGQTNGRHAHITSSSSQPQYAASAVPLTDDPSDIDRGYFSSNEAANRHTPKDALNKQGSAAVSAISAVSPVQSRATSVRTDRMSVASRNIGSTDDLREPISTVAPTSQRSSTMDAISSVFGSRRSVTSPQIQSKPQFGASPLITNLETSSAAPTSSDKSSPAATPSSSGINLGMFSSAKAKVTGLRSSSDAITKDEKHKTASPTEKIPMPIREKGISSPTSSTPSMDTRSIEAGKADSNARTSTGSGGLMPAPPNPKRKPARTKQSTSAYTRGLEKKPPAEQMATCDYSGWMKKKSGSLMTTWKPRLFILRGRRLSYYYRDDDVEEKGLIDISFHRVLPAQNETLTGLHATMTGAASGGGPTSPTMHSTPTTAQQDLVKNPPKAGDGDEGLFIFKLVPPKTGLSKGVYFTKPTVHYFAVNSRQEGRLWMAALMKATIDRDDDGVVTTTYNQKTISLQKARARQERPPALKEKGGGVAAAELAGEQEGLGIGGLSGPRDSATTPGAEKERFEDASSYLGSATNDDGSVLGVEEREAVPMSGHG